MLFRSRDLFGKLMAFDRTENQRTAYNTYTNNYSPEAVMKSFEKYLIMPALTENIDTDGSGMTFGSSEIASFHFRNLGAKIQKYLIMRKRR